MFSSALHRIDFDQPKLHPLAVLALLLSRLGQEETGTVGSELRVGDAMLGIQGEGTVLLPQ